MGLGKPGGTRSELSTVDWNDDRQASLLCMQLGFSIRIHKASGGLVSGSRGLLL